MVEARDLVPFAKVAVELEVADRGDAFRDAGAGCEQQQRPAEEQMTKMAHGFGLTDGRRPIMQAAKANIVDYESGLGC
jgi:hypothetical protein